MKKSYQEIQEKTDSVKDLLDNTGQGFFTFDAHYRIHPEYSKACTTFFGKPIENLDALQLLFGPQAFSDEPAHTKTEKYEEQVYFKDSMQEILDMIFKGRGSFDLFGELLPSEIKIGQFILSLDYRMINSTRDEQKIMIILTDVTLERALADQIQAEEELNAMIIKVAIDREGFIQFLGEVNGLFLSIKSLLVKTPKTIDVNELFRYYHTIKGGTASYGMKKVAEKAHSIEALLEKPRNGEKLIEEMLRLISEETENLHHIFTETLDLLSNILPTEDRNRTESIYQIRESQIVSLENALQKTSLKSSEAIQTIINQFRYQPIQTILQKYANAAEELGSRLNKSVQVEIQSNDVMVSYSQLQNLFGSLIHLVRNSVDHGLEAPEDRIMLDKSEVGTLKLFASSEGNTLKLVISDDGGGIDPEVIKKVAISKEIISESDANSAFDNELINLIFEPGFSTHESVTEVSGRGVGMDAVKSDVEKLGGTIQIQTELDRGTAFIINIPNIL